jgi:hypothetical protein
MLRPKASGVKPSAGHRRETRRGKKGKKAVRPRRGRYRAVFPFIFRVTSMVYTGSVADPVRSHRLVERAGKWRP